jgi:hypothetical protein
MASPDTSIYSSDHLELNTTPLEMSLRTNLFEELIKLNIGRLGEVTSALNDLYPAVGELRVILATYLSNLMQKISFQRIYGTLEINPAEIGTFTAELVTALHESGFVTSGELGGILLGKDLPDTLPLTKYRTYEELVKMRYDEDISEEGPWGLVHGGLRPAHWGHARLIKKTKEYCRTLLVGFDPSWDLKRRKRRLIGQDIQLAAAMHQVACLPFVDYVFVLPYTEIAEKKKDEEMLAIYRRLGIGALGAGPDNYYLKKYHARMEVLNGIVVEDEMDRVTSSTSIMNMQSFYAVGIGKPIVDHYQLFMAHIDIIARQHGFLRDYPDLTENRKRKEGKRRLIATGTIT